ncbi:ATP-binding protein [Prevotella copri]|uniref:ATP-binding protein n=1 Tax=Segatella copri TaxID=165179 RepID=A0AAW4NC27_9BACT|nr:ATP-binding protein [Segatella copri]MBU9910915.1 ATP-binding protein [Segatella copri]MBV3398750.1 ATP-binding protein [Segatella copri]MBV3408263.1 ATP-binding protein [Segatella copri]MBV3411190.1 ATP-binding protein [Segatella copri]MBV3419645.1 ATP-binding protein [Segatella copri]
MEQQVKLVPYGVADFATVIEQNLYYVDKTMFIPELEKQPRNLFFIRPRRFGKSIFLSMLYSYYDCTQSHKFQSLFGNLWIGQHPTPLQGKYQVLFLDFSQITGNIDKLETKFNSYLSINLDAFVRQYSEYYQAEMEEILAQEDFEEKMELIFKAAKAHQYHLYLIIDEYDNFTNVILNERGENVYHAITHADGFYRDVFKKFKGNFERIFMMGVSPVTLDDVTSGFNIGWNISIKPEFDEMLGFSTTDVVEMFTYYKEHGSIPADSDIDAIVNDMKPWYDNYCFAEEALKKKTRMFNCDMVLYYLCNYMDNGCSPRQMIDPNTRTDYGKMKKLLQFDKLDGERKGIIRKIAEEEQIVTQLYESFSAYQIPKAEIFPSLLFYYGMLTIKGTRGSKLILGIPNNNVRKQYYGYLEEEYQAKAYVDVNQLTDYYYDMAYNGKWEEGLRFMADAYAKVSSVRDGIEAERNLQGFFMAYLNLNDYYITAPELELNHGYCDFFLLPDLTHYASQHSYILELKVLSKKDFSVIVEGAFTEDGKPMTKAEKQWREALDQIHRYAEAPRVEALRQGTKLHLIIMQFEGWELKRMEEV